MRSIAVVPVVLFHVELNMISGGFAGVDVFFVISGYLITSIIVAELREGRFSLANFYERRIRRIFPALFALIGTVLLLGPVLFMPDDLRNIAQSAVAATVFSSNVLFFWEDGYFDAAAFTKPLLHTWSLAIEEQFYIVVPLLLMILARRRGRFALWIGMITAASLALSVLTTSELPMAAYYLLPWRAWELGIGALLALGVVPALTHRGLRELTALVGLAAILATMVMIDKSTPFPGVAALAPVLGTALVLHAGAAGPTLTGHLLSLRPFVWIGKLSYSLYLWHWPVIVFFVYWKMGMPDGVEIPILIALSVLLAWISWRFVEQPFRRPADGRDRRWVFSGAGAAMAVMIAGGLVIHLAKGFPQRLPDEAQRLIEYTRDREPRHRDCHIRPNRAGDWSEPCLYGDEGAAPARVAIWGDSMAAALVPALDVAGRNHGVAVALFSRNGCPGVQDFELHQFRDGYHCSPFIQSSFEVLLNDPDIETVVMTLRADLYVHGWIEEGFGEHGRAPLKVGPANGPLPNSAARLDFLIKGLEESIAKLRAAGKSVALIYPTPVSGNTVPISLARYVLRGGNPEDMILPKDLFTSRTSEIMARYDRLVDTYNLKAIRLDKKLCSETGCQLIRDGSPVFYDRGHMTRTVAEGFAPAFSGIFQALDREARK